MPRFVSASLQLVAPGQMSGSLLRLNQPEGNSASVFSHNFVALFGWVGVNAPAGLKGIMRGYVQRSMHARSSVFWFFVRLVFSQYHALPDAVC
jgi:hypothetical protein